MAKKLVNCMSMSKEVKEMAENRELKEKSSVTVLTEDLSVNADSEQGPQVKEVERLHLKEVERLQVKEEVSWSLKKRAEVRLAEVLEWLVADPQVLDHCFHSCHTLSGPYYKLRQELLGRSYL